MKIYMGKRGSGKTTRLIKYCYENDCVLVTPVSWKYIQSDSKEKGMPITVISHKQFRDRLTMSGRGKEKYVIDEVLMFVEDCMKNRQGEIAAISIDAEENNVNIIRRGNDSKVNVGGIEVTVLDWES